MDSSVVMFANLKKLNRLSFNIFVLNFYQNQNKWTYTLISVEISKNDESDRVVDLLIYKNHYPLNNKLNVFLRNHNKNFICRRCLNSYSIENMLMIHKLKWEIYDITTIRTSSESHLHWKGHFRKNPLYFRIIVDFEADNETDNSNIGNKTPNIYRQNPVLNGYRILSELEEVLKSVYYESPLGNDHIDWYVNEVIKSKI